MTEEIQFELEILEDSAPTILIDGRVENTLLPLGKCLVTQAGSNFRITAAGHDYVVANDEDAWIWARDWDRPKVLLRSRLEFTRLASISERWPVPNFTYVGEDADPYPLYIPEDHRRITVFVDGATDLDARLGELVSLELGIGDGDEYLEGVAEPYEGLLDPSDTYTWPTKLRGRAWTAVFDSSRPVNGYTEVRGSFIYPINMSEPIIPTRGRLSMIRHRFDEEWQESYSVFVEGGASDIVLELDLDDLRDRKEDLDDLLAVSIMGDTAWCLSALIPAVYRVDLTGKAPLKHFYLPVPIRDRVNGALCPLSPDSCLVVVDGAVMEVGNGDQGTHILTDVTDPWGVCKHDNHVLIVGETCQILGKDGCEFNSDEAEIVSCADGFLITDDQDRPGRVGIDGTIAWGASSDLAINQLASTEDGVLGLSEEGVTLFDAALNPLSTHPAPVEACYAQIDLGKPGYVDEDNVVHWNGLMSFVRSYSYGIWEDEEGDFWVFDGIMRPLLPES